MSSVNITTAIKYGFVVVAYFIGILVVGGIGFAVFGLSATHVDGAGGDSA